MNGVRRSFEMKKSKNHRPTRMFDRAALQIITNISPQDRMYLGNLDHYLNVGMSALECIENALFIANKEVSDIKKILDFSCGHGRVMRVIKAGFPDAKITACDRDKDAVDFCAKTFDASPIYASRRVSEINIDDSFDLIFNGSLLTHLDSPLWPQYIRLFESLLAPDGILIFTVHGRLSIDWLKEGHRTYGLDEKRISKIIRDYENEGFGYANYSQMNDYGISISSPSWVLSCLEETNLRVMSYMEHQWDNHQDVIICTKN